MLLLIFLIGPILIRLRCSYGEELNGDSYMDDDVAYLNDQDFERAQNMDHSELYKKDAVLPQKSKFRGDIVGKAALYNKLRMRRRKNLRRNGVRMTFDKWPGSKIPYVISQRYNQRERAILARAFQTYHDRTCIRFVPHQNERDYLYVGKIDGCFSDVGRAGGRQELSLDDGCMQYDTATHELMHAVGFWHEHERSDRDEFITIVWQNIDRDAYDQFGKVNQFESNDYGETYDYYSLMHYESRSFSKNGRSTIEAKSPGMTFVMGKAKDLSVADLRKINKMYNCLAPSAGSSSSSPSFNNVQFAPVPRPTPLHYLDGAYGAGYNTNFEQPRVTGQPGFITPNCRDKGTLCYLWIPRCKVLAFKWLLKNFCQFTCGFCNEALDPVENSIYRSPMLG